MLKSLTQEEWRVEVFPPGIDGLVIISMSYQLELDAVSVSLSSGTIALVHTDSEEVEEVGCVDSGILALEWSPDGEVLAMITGSGNLLIMSQEWEALSEVSLHDSGASVSAGTISWRGDGKFFATGFNSESGSR